MQQSSSSSFFASHRSLEMSMVPVWFLVVTLALPGDPARILGILSTPSRSHHFFNRALMLELAARGHQVTVFSPDPEAHPVPNYRDIVFEGAYAAVDAEYDYQQFRKLSHVAEVRVFFEWGLSMCEKALKSTGGQQLVAMSRNETFDLIIFEVVIQECLLPIVSLFGSPPVVGISSYVNPPWANDMMGNEQNPSYVNTYTLPLTDRMSFWQRLANFVFDSFVRAYRTYFYLPKQDEISRKYFGESVPLPSELERNFSLVLVNSHFSMNYPQPQVPSIVPVSGLHVKPAEALPKDVQELLDSAPQGVIYMSLGTNVRSDRLSEQRLRAFLEAFQELPQRVLWKWESDSLPGQPPNVNITKWAPQNDVLAHPNVRAFVTQGGAMSMSEAVFHGVPVVGVPFLTDQYGNIRRAAHKGVAVELDSLALTKGAVLQALRRVLHQPRMSTGVVWLPLLLLLLLLLVSPCEPARVLGLVSTPSRSHHFFNRALMLALAARGHQVTVFSPDPEDRPVPNLRDVVWEGAYGEDTDYQVLSHLSYSQEVVEFFDWGLQNCGNALKSDGARQLIDLTRNETFDLVIAEVMVQECLLPFVAKFGNPPIVGITAYGSPPWANDLVGNYQNPSFVNTFNLPYSLHMTFLQRVTNFLFDVYVWYYRNYVYMPKQDQTSRQFFGESAPLPSEIEKNISLVMVNAFLGTHYPQPQVPAVIPVGGMQVKPPQKLPKDLQEFLDSSPQGVIYMSLGTNVRSDRLGEEKRRAFLDAFRELPLKVLWKWESDSLPGQPSNVKIIKWVPQNDVLAHPNVKAFISHGGMLSTSEAVHHGVPVVGIPFFADQYVNLRRTVAHGGAVLLDSTLLTKESVLGALNLVLNDPSYRERMKHLSAIYRDRPQTALETAVWWTEYALRHHGAPHLRCSSLDLLWYQRHLLDVVAFLLLVAATGGAAVCLVVRKLLSALQVKGGKVKTN